MSFAKDNTLELYVNSAIDKNENENEADFTVNFTNPILIPNQGRLEIALKSISAPNTCPEFSNEELSYKILQEGQPEITLSIDQDRVFSTVGTFITYWQAQLNAVTGVDLTITQDVNNKRIRIVNNSVGYIRFYLEENKAFWNKLGFQVSQQEGDPYMEIAASSSALALRAMVLIRTSRYYLCCPQVYNNAKTKDNNFSEIISDVDLNNGFGSYNSEDKPYLYYHNLTNSGSVDFLRFYLVDDKRRPIEYLNGGSVSMAFIIRLMTN